jgi:hypothetical protein
MSNNKTGEMSKETDAPVLLILDREGFLVRAGKPPNTLKEKREVGQYAIEGYTLKTITIEEYRRTNFKWFWENEKHIEHNK